MPVRLAGETVHLEGHCTAEEALLLQEFLLDARQAGVSMENCASLHTALLQVLLAANPPLIAGPQSLSLLRCVSHLLTPRQQ